MIAPTRPLTDFSTCAEDVSRICRPYHLAAPRWREFRGSVRNFTAAALNFTELNLGCSRMSRQSEAGAQSAPPYYSLVLQLRGSARVTQRRSEAVLGPGDLILLKSSEGVSVEVSEGTHQMALNFFQPGDVARLDPVATAGGRRIPRAAGPARLLSDELMSVVRNAADLDGVDMRGHAIDLLLASLGEPSPAAMRHVRGADIEDILRYVDAHLHHASLCPRQLASRFSMSLRQLYRIAGDAQLTPAALIWQRRLQRALQLLAGEGNLSITRIAHQCGFKDSAHFSRAFRKSYGEAPSRMRRPPAV